MRITHALAVDVADLQCHRLGDAQSCAISHAQRRQLARLADECRAFHEVGATERDLKEEP